MDRLERQQERENRRFVKQLEKQERKDQKAFLKTLNKREKTGFQKAWKESWKE